MISKCHTHVAARRIVHDQVKSGLTLEREVETNDELVGSQAEYIALRSGIPDQVL